MAVFRSRRDLDPVGPVDPAVQRVVDAARDTSGEVDTVALEAALAAYRRAGEGPVAAAATEPVTRPTRRHRLVRAFAATTVGTKVVIGVATAAALGGIGVGVAATAGHSPPPAPVTTTGVPSAPATAGPTGSGSGSGPSTVSPSASASATPSTSDSLTGSTQPSSSPPATGDTGAPSSSTPTPRLPSSPVVPPSAT